MSKTNVKVEILSSSPDVMIDMALKLERSHLEKGDASPLLAIDMKTFSEKLKRAIANRNEARKLHEQAETLNQQAMLDLGISKTQNSKTPGTIYNLLTSARDILMGINRGQEEKLNEWGFKVVSGTTSAKAKNAEK